MRVSEQLDRAADVIERRGWVGRQPDCDPAYGPPDQEPIDPWGLDGVSPVCIEGAIMAVQGTDQFPTTYDVQWCPAYRAMAAYLETPYRLFNWNDRPERTKDEVIAALRGAAAVERTREEALQMVGV